MIICQQNVFHIKTEGYSYLFRINEYGIPEHLHFGAPVQREDPLALSRPGLGLLHPAAGKGAGPHLPG